MFKITGSKEDGLIRECTASKAEDLPDKDECIRMGIHPASECIVIGTEGGYMVILDEDYTWKEI